MQAPIAARRRHALLHFPQSSRLLAAGGPDIIIGAPAVSVGEPAGKAYIIYGRMTATGCYAACDDSGYLEVFDFLCFQNRFTAGDPWADCDGSGKLDFFDFLCFQNEFAAGC